MKQSVDGDPSFSSPWESFFAHESCDSSDACYFWTEDNRYLLVLVTPQKTDSFARAEHSLKALRKTIAQVRVFFPDVNVGVTGQEALNADEMGAAALI